MNNKQILKKAIKKAWKNGWRYCSEESPEMIMLHFSNGLDGDDGLVPYKYFMAIFSHDFAKAFWGGKKEVDIIVCSNHKCKDRDIYFHKVSNWGNLTEAKKHMKDFPYCSSCGKKMCIEKMEENIENPLYHLQTMVLKEKPLKYLEKFI